MNGQVGLRSPEILATALVVLTALPACTIRIGTGGGFEEEFQGAGGSNGTTTSSSTATSGSSDSEPTAEEIFSQIDPQELAIHSTRASFAAAYAIGAVESLGLDPATLDEAELLDLMTQYMPVAIAEADQWIATLDPSALAAGIVVKYECSAPDIGCEAVTFCQRNPPPVVHQCHVVDCGDAGCPLCPSWVGELLKHLIYKRWCAYTCVQFPSSPAKVVAIGAGFVSSFKNTFGGPVCMPSSSAP